MRVVYNIAMSKEELQKLAEKIKNNTATEEERLSFFKALNELVVEMSAILDGQG